MTLRNRIWQAWYYTLDWMCGRFWPHRLRLEGETVGKIPVFEQSQLSLRTVPGEIWGCTICSYVEVRPPPIL